jgi:hypothetical protein
MAIAEDLDHATDSQWDWVAEHTRTRGLRIPQHVRIRSR